MSKFVGRQRELAELNAVIAQGGAQFVLVYGRRRVGKTTLVLRWAEQTGRPFIYWVATRDTPAQVRQGLTQALWGWAHPESQAVPRFDTWAEVFETAGSLIGGQPVILIMDEFSYAVESDPSLPSNLQAAWDHLFKDRNVAVVLAGSHIGLMVDLMGYHAPLYGRFTAQLPVEPLPFPAVSEFLPRYSTAEQVAVYAVAGGIPAYLERFNDRERVGTNIQRLFMRRTGMFRSEPFVLVGDVIRRETQTYEGVLKAVAAGKRTPQEIGKAVGLTSSYVSPYLKQLEALHLIERRLPATVPPDRRETSRISRYHLADPYLRFYFRFIAPNLGPIEQGLTRAVWQRIGDQFRAFVGKTAFEELCREWTLVRAREGRLPFLPEIVGNHWSSDAEVDVVAINWREQAILLGGCRWGVHAVGQSAVRELVEKAPYVVPAEDWDVHYAYFSRAGFTDAACAGADAVGMELVKLERLNEDLKQALL
jgi:AAA+ ATPase superfamily predicted ATPase